METSPFTYTGDIPPLSRSIPEVCREVFNLLTSDEATIDDLSLPPREKLSNDFDATMNAILFRFHKVPDCATVPMSATTPSMNGGGTLALIDLYYSDREATAAPEMLESRILHEATHAIRHVLIQLSDQEGVDPQRLKTPTPEKAPKTMKFDAARAQIPLYKLDSSAFHSGYYTEHKLLGGVWVQLLGYILDENDVPVQLSDAGLIFKVTHKGEARSVKVGPRNSTFTFARLSGFDQGGNYKEIFHYGSRVTRSDDEGACDPSP